MPLYHLFDPLVVIHTLLFAESLDLPSHVWDEGNLVVQLMRYLTLVEMRG